MIILQVYKYKRNFVLKLDSCEITFFHSLIEREREKEKKASIKVRTKFKLKKHKHKLERNRNRKLKPKASSRIPNQNSDFKIHSSERKRVYSVKTR